MKVRIITDKPTENLADALARFESQFTYPLGAEGRFRIAHGEDYTRFYRSLGDAASFAIERDGEILGVVALALRRLVTPRGESLTAAYIGDLKVSSACARGRVVTRLVQAARDWIGDRADAAFGVVMGGSDATPESYTGRLGIPRFERVGELAILRIPCRIEGVSHGHAWTIQAAEGIARFTKRAQGRYTCQEGDPQQRSIMCPRWFGDPEGDSCGRLEDTRRAKKLFDVLGCELMSAHLSSLAFENVNAACSLVRATLGVAAELGFSHLFLSIPEPIAGRLVRSFAADIQYASATVYGTGVSPGLWSLNTAEI